ncbi:hypothetical protein GQR58_015608 [Nymphon striatum]|nr:hypothetical protein GQR58_015608 [Nymphon striatum]
MEERLEAYEMWIYRRIGKVSWTERKTNEYVLRMLGIKKQLLNIVKERKLKYYGHIKKHQTVQRTTLEGKVEGKRSRGKQRLKWEDNIKGWTKRKSYELADQCVSDIRSDSSAGNVTLNDTQTDDTATNPEPQKRKMVKKRQFSSSDEMDPEDINLETFRVVNELKVNQKHMQDDIDKLKLALVMTWRISSAVLVAWSALYITQRCEEVNLMLFHQYFKNVPGYLSTAGTAYRSTSATAEKRIEKENDTLEAAIKNMWNGDGVTTLSALIDKLKTDETVPANAYRNLLNHQILCLPSISTLQKVTNKTRRFSTNEYLTIRSKELNSQQQNVILMVDEIYTSKRMEYSSATGKIFGLTTESQLCGTLLCFMICSLNCPYKDVVSLIPINVITAKKLEVHCNNVLKLLDNIGFNVVLICMDNHPVNRSYITKILCEGNLKPQVKNPINGNPLFVLFDPVHNFKNVYNNFQSKKIFKYPDFNSIDSISINTASFHDLIDLCNIESDKPIRMAHKLTTTCLNPISIEKTCVKLACAIFHESTRDALKFFTSQMNKPWEGTHKFVSLILKLWNIINVKSTTKGYHKCNIQQDPLLSINDWKLNFISDFSKFLEIWHSNGAKHGLSKETFTALHHMCLTLPALAKYAFEELGFQYVLLGMFQSDPIESRFGWYRQLSGANYYVSAKQVIESEEKIKAISLMKFTNFDLNSVSNSIDKEIISSDDIQLIEDALNEISDSYHCQINHNDVNIIYYVAAAIIKTELRQSRCEDCKKILVDSSTNLHSMNFDQFDKIDQSVKQFVAQSSNHNTFFNKVVFSFTEISAIEHNNLCPNGHKFVNNIVNRFFNCCMKNFVKDISNELICKKRKITKLSSEWLKEMFKIFSKGSRFNQIKKKSAFAMLKICLYDTSLAYCRILLVQASSPEVRERGGGACIQTSMTEAITSDLPSKKLKRRDFVAMGLEPGATLANKDTSLTDAAVNAHNGKLVTIRSGREPLSSIVNRL